MKTIRTKHNYWTNYLILSLVLLCFFFFFQFSKNSFAQGSLKKLWQKELNSTISSHTVSSNGKFVAIGDQDGFVHVYDQNGAEYFSHQFQFPILDLAFAFDETSLYVRCYSVYCIDLTEQRIVWEKYYQPDQFYIEDFWVFQDGKIGYLASSLTQLQRYYFLSNSDGVTIEEPKGLPNTHFRYRITPSPDGKLLIWTTEEGSIECMSYYGFVHWNKQVSFSNQTSSDSYPFLQDINNNGDVCISFSQNTEEASLHTILMINLDGVILWERTTKDPVKILSFSHHKESVLVGTSKQAQLYDLSGNMLQENKIFGYRVESAQIFYSHLLIQFQPNSEIRPSFFQKGIVELNWMDNVIWRKHTIENSRTGFSLADNGYAIIEVCYPKKFSFYMFHFNNTQRKV